MQKAPGGIITGFEVAIQVFDGRILLRIYGVQKSSQTQTFSNKASFLCPQGCVLFEKCTRTIHMGPRKSDAPFDMNS